MSDSLKRAHKEFTEAVAKTYAPRMSPVLRVMQEIEASVLFHFQLAKLSDEQAGEYKRALQKFSNALAELDK